MILKIFAGRIHALRIAIVLSTLAILLLAGNASALSNGNGSWQYYRNIIINNTGGTLTDYQVLINLNSSNFPTNAQNSGADIRFTDATGNELSYWIESWDFAGTNAKIWVKVTNIPANSNTILTMYYDNPAALSVSNGDNTFEFFDDFEDGVIDSSKWQKYDLHGNIGTATEADGVMKLTVTTTTGGVSPPVLPSVPIFADGIIELKWKIANGANVPHALVNFRYDGTVSQQAAVRGGNYNDLYFYDGQIFGSVPYEALSNHINEWHFMRIKFHGTGAEIYVKNLMTGLDESTSGTLSNTITNPIGLSVWNAGQENHYDDIRVRKYAYPEPSISVGAAMQEVPSLLSIIRIFLTLLLVILIVALVVLWLRMLIDCLKRPDDKFAYGGNNAKLIWIIVIVFIGFIGALIYYFLIKKTDKEEKGGIK